MRVEAKTRSGLFAESCADALAVLDADQRSGLTAQDAARRLTVYGENKLERVKQISVLSLLIDQLRSMIVWLLCAAVVLSLLVGDVAEAIAIIVVLVINTAIGFFTSWNAIRSIEALFRLTAVTARVRRDGHSEMVPVERVVPGDVIILEAGDIVPADLRLLQVDNLQCDESALTGESAPVAKSRQTLPADSAMPDRINLAFKGTAVTRGEGLGVVATIGPETEIGRISTLAQTAEATAFPLEKRLDKLVQTLVLLILVHIICVH